MRVIDLRATPTSPSSRHEWMDVVRGTAVVLIIIFHASPILRVIDVRPPVVVSSINDFFGSFRIPALVFLSGMLLGPSLSKPVGAYLDGKFRRIVWPHLVWVSIWAIFSWPAAIEHPSFFVGGNYLWFLVFIGFYYLLALPLRRVPPAVVVVAALALAVAAPDGSKYGERLAFLFAIFMAGHLVMQSGFLASRWSRSWWVAGLGLAATVVSFFFEVKGYTLITLPEKIGGILMLIVLARRGQALLVRVGLGFLGRNSLIFYVSHFPAMVLLSRAFDGVALPQAAVWSATITGALGVGVLLALSAGRRPVSWLFTCPFTLVRRSAAAPQGAVPAPRGPESRPALTETSSS